MGKLNASSRGITGTTLWKVALPESPPETSASASIPTTGRRGPMWWAMALTAAAAMLLSGYLTYAAASIDGPVGCGAGSACSEVLGSRWSKWFGLPVSTIAMVLYGGVLWLLLAARTWMPRRSATVWLLMLAAAGAMLGAAAWFTYVQLAIIHALCPWCMVGHGLGVTLAILLATAVGQMHPPKPGAGKAAGAVIVGLLSVVLIAVPQVVTQERSHISGEGEIIVPSTGPIGTRPSITLFNDLIAIEPDREPAIGPADAQHTLVAFVDYACPHCRHAHDLILERGDVNAYIVPVPLNTDCNPHAPESMPDWFDQSCALATLAYEAHHFGNGVFQPFDRWLFTPEDPPAATDARDHLASLLTNVTAPRIEPGSLEAKVQRNVQWYGQLIEHRIANRLPILVHPESGRRLVGKVHSTDDLDRLIAGEPDGE